MTEITTTWHSPTQRKYSTGIDRGMLYVDDKGVTWSGLISISHDAGEGAIVKRYIDGMIYDVRIPPTDFSGSINAFTYPEEFDSCLGNELIPNTGIIVHGQFAKTFDLAYRSFSGDAAGMDKEYVIHILYGCYARETDKASNTINASPEAENFGFEIHSVPVEVAGYRPSSYFTIDSRQVDHAVLRDLENILYGSDDVDAALPTLQEIRDYLEG